VQVAVQRHGNGSQTAQMAATPTILDEPKREARVLAFPVGGNAGKFLYSNSTTPPSTMSKTAANKPVKPAVAAAKAAKGAKTGAKAPKVVRKTFVIDCSEPHAEDENLIDTATLAGYLSERIKVDSKRGNLGENVKVTHNATAVSVEANAPFSKRQLKYLAKKFLKKEELRDFLHVIASSATSYKLRFFNVAAKAPAE
jgi:large subunit ribosomal protein L22e